VVVDDAWGVAGEGEGADLTIDASDVRTEAFAGLDGLWMGESDIGAVFINATQETDARLHITGSAQSSNILLGGAQADTIVGGAGDDILYGGAVWGVHGAADVLEGGAGDDLYVIAFSQLDPDQMVTIKGLDLGGVGDDESADRINLGTLFAIGDYDANVAGELYSILNTANAFHLGEGGEDGQGIVNNGLPIDITNTGATLQQAVNELFAANGVFQSTSDAAINSAGLFTYGEDTYLIAVGEDAEGGFGADDFIVKVTGYTGTLDASDFADLYSYVPVP
jgi:hypothetical protein